MRIFLITLLIFGCSALSFAQSWEKGYQDFITTFESQDYNKTIELGAISLIEIETETGREDTNYCSVLNYLAYSYFLLQDYQTAVSFAEIELDLRTKIHGTNHPNYFTMAYGLSMYYTYVGAWSKSAPLYQEVLNNLENQIGNNNIEYVNAANTLANIYNQAGSYKVAERIYERSYSTVKKLYGELDSIVLTMHNMMSAFYTGSGNYQKSEPYFFDALKLMEKNFGKLSTQYLLSYNSLGELYIYAGWFEKAEKIYRKNLEYCIEFYGKGSADHATALNNLAVSLEGQGKYEEAVGIYYETLKIKAEVFKKESDYYALTLSNLALVYENMNEYDKAEKILTEALEIYRTVYGATHINYATALNNMASIYSSKGNYTKSIELSFESLVIQRDTYGTAYKGYLNTMATLAYTYMTAGSFHKADSLYTICTQTQEKVLGENHFEYGITLNNQASLKSSMGQYEQAELLIKKALKIHLKNENNETNIANTYFNLGNHYLTIGNLRKARQSFDKCKELFVQIYGTMHPQYAVFLHSMGLFYIETTEYDLAEKTLKRALEIQHNSFGEEHPDQVNILQMLASVHTAQGQFQNAEKTIKQAIKIAHNLGEDNPDYSNSVSSLGILYYNLGNYEQAEPLYLKSLELTKKIYGEQHSEYGNSLNNLGTLYMAKALFTFKVAKSTKNADLAYYYFHQSLKIDSLTNRLKTTEHATHLNNLAELYRGSGQYEIAAEHFTKAIDIMHKVYEGENNDMAITYQNLALCYQGDGKLQKAEDYALKALAIKIETFGEESSQMENVTSVLASIYDSKDQLDLALKYHQLTLKSSNKALKSSFEHLSEKEQSEYSKLTEVTNYLFYDYAVRRQNDQPELARLVLNNEIYYKGIILRSANRMKAEILASNDTALLNKYYLWVEKKQQLAKQYSKPVNNRLSTIDTLEFVSNRLEKELVNLSSDFKDHQAAESVDWKKLRAGLNSEEVLIEFIHFPHIVERTINQDLYCALILKHDDESPKFIKLFIKSQLDSLIGKTAGNDLDYINSLYGSKVDLNPKLYELIWKPISKHITGAKTAYYSPTGLLNKVAFQALALDSKHYLSQSLNLKLINSPLNLVNKSEPLLSKKLNISIFGGANYNTDSSTTEIWKYLAGTKTEAEHIQNLFAKTNLQQRDFIGANATEENFKTFNGFKSPDIIHIATHGFFYADPEEIQDLKAEETTEGLVEFRGAGIGAETFVANKDPLMRSGLVFSGANQVWNKSEFEGDDGVLTAFEVADMNLQNTKLVVLSACETGLGDIKGSEGVYGLQRAFKKAGVESLIMSLWQVPDKETEEFMTIFYTELLKSNNVKTSFAFTQETMRKKYDPYFWGAFILVQ
ncbi:MAG: tetratricopeptide (TPR) repeat protein/CHAT domain-containing protein [Parvicellaceae bacterium]|jgi:tetratricopeptide (TPR) repeat protein/CHAT domain-containing protein